MRSDGSLWAADAESGTVIVETDIGADADFPPVVLPGGRVALPLGGRCLGVIQAPALLR